VKRSLRDGSVSAKIISRRGLLLGGAQAVFIGILGIRMRFLQVEEADQFRLLAEENRINIRLLPPVRGQIFDRNGAIIAENEPSYRITIVREDAGNIETVLDKLSQLVELNPDAMSRALAEIKRSARFLPVTILDRVTWADISRVAVNAPALPGITPEVGLSRRYPMGNIFAHVAGYVGPVSSRDLERIADPEPILKIPRFQIGKVGIEAEFETLLRGRTGTKRVEVNSLGRMMRELDRQEGEAGVNLQLTVNAQLQDYVQARLGEQSASAVVIDCRTGDLLAIASTPSYDPNKFVRRISVKDFSSLRNDIRRPLASKTVQDAYPPGSVFKMLTALAGLDAGLITEDTTVFCPGHLEVSGRRFHCWKRSGHGTVNLESSLRESCDVFYYELALKVGIEKIAEIARRFGLGTAHDIPMSRVASGLTPDKDWKRKNRGADWVIGDTVNAAIGQGYVLTSPLQLAVMAARLASGQSVVPRLIKKIDGVEQGMRLDDPLGLQEKHLNLVRKAMYEVSNNRRGTAYKSRVIDKKFRLAGKTGTSQVRNITEAERERGVTKNINLPWNRRDHALFVNFAPFDAPEIAVAVVVEHGGGGSKIAAPIARDITLQALYDGDPPLSAYPAKDRPTIEAQREELKNFRQPFKKSGKSKV
jgi:penicillin-binding protein 2